MVSRPARMKQGDEIHKVREGYWPEILTLGTSWTQKKWNQSILVLRNHSSFVKFKISIRFVATSHLHSMGVQCNNWVWMVPLILYVLARTSHFTMLWHAKSTTIPSSPWGSGNFIPTYRTRKYIHVRVHALAINHRTQLYEIYACNKAGNNLL